METIQVRINKGLTLEQLFSQQRKEFPYHGDSVILFDLLTVAKEMGKPFKRNELNKCIRKQVEDKLDERTKENLKELLI